MCTCTCKTGAVLQQELQLGGAGLYLAARNYTDSAKPLHLSVWPASTLQFVCMDGTISRCAGSQCCWSNLSSLLHAQQHLQPLKERAGALLTSFLAAWLVSPFFSPFFSLLWQSSLVGKAKPGVSEALECKQTSSSWALTGKICVAQCGHHSVQYLWAARKDFQAGEEPEGPQFFDGDSVCEK